MLGCFGGGVFWGGVVCLGGVWEQEERESSLSNHKEGSCITQGFLMRSERHTLIKKSTLDDKSPEHEA
jgi:hypothetical protein